MAPANAVPQGVEPQKACNEQGAGICTLSEYQCGLTGATPRAGCPTKRDPLRLFDGMSYAKATDKEG